MDSRDDITAAPMNTQAFGFGGAGLIGAIETLIKRAEANDMTATASHLEMAVIECEPANDMERLIALSRASSVLARVSNDVEFDGGNLADRLLGAAVLRSCAACMVRVANGMAAAHS